LGRRWGKEEVEYAEEEEQQQQQQQQDQQQEQQQQLPLADGHDFEPPSLSPRSAVGLHGMDVQVPFVLRSADDLATPYTNYTSGYKVRGSWLAAARCDCCSLKSCHFV
jgi:transcription initiation factor TFIID subunit TAF12